MEPVKVYEPKSATWEESYTKWVLFPNGKEYMLPLVRAKEQLIPVFREDGTVGLLMENRDDALASLAEQVVIFAAASETTDSLALTEQFYGTLMLLVRKLLAANYAFSDIQLTEILTLSKDQFAYLFGVILQHVR